MGAGRVDNPNPEFWVWAKALAASAAGRALLLLSATRSETPSVAKLVGVALYELPLVGAFAVLGWHAAGVLGASSEEWRVTITVMLAWAGQRGLDMVLQRIFPPRP